MYSCAYSLTNLFCSSYPDNERLEKRVEAEVASGFDYIASLVNITGLFRPIDLHEFNTFIGEKVRLSYCLYIHILI